MSTAIEAIGLTKVFGRRGSAAQVRALDDVNVTFAAGQIHGLLGRNGAGKTTLMKLLTAQLFATSGSVRIFGANPIENPDALSRTCFIQESQRLPETLTAAHLLTISAGLYPRWNPALAARLVTDFALPTTRPIDKLSRGQRSAIGIVVGLASRAEVTFFDEPYLGLDAVARHLFYDRLLEDYTEHPRTVILSTHHIDEAANLLEHLVVLDRGRVLFAEDADEVRARAYQVTGRASAVREFAVGKTVIHTDALGQIASAAIQEELGAVERRRAHDLGLDIAPVSLQNLFVHLLADDRGALESPDSVPAMADSAATSGRSAS